MSSSAKVFKSAKALQQHQRIAHKLRSPIPCYLDDSGICPACSVNLFHRTKVITHACESRHRGKVGSLRCMDVILSGSIPRVPVDLFIKYEERDRMLKRDAKRIGNTHIQTFRPAKRVANASLNRIAAMSRPPVARMNNPGSGAKRRGDANSNISDKRRCIRNDDVIMFYPVKRIVCKTSILHLQHVPAKRLRTRSDSKELYRRIHSCTDAV